MLELQEREEGWSVGGRERQTVNKKERIKLGY